MRQVVKSLEITISGLDCTRIVVHTSSMATEKINKRNQYGIKSSSDLYRTIKGAHYICWTSCATDDLKAAYKQAGIRVAMRAGELFIHHLDEEEAKQVDKSRGYK